MCTKLGMGGRESHACMWRPGRYEGADVCSCGKREKRHWYEILSFLVITLEGSIASFPQKLDNEPSLERWNAATCPLCLCLADPGSQSVWNAYIGSDSAGTQLLLLSHEVHETFVPNFRCGCKSVPANGRAGGADSLLWTLISLRQTSQSLYSLKRNKGLGVITDQLCNYEFHSTAESKYSHVGKWVIEK